MSWLAGWDASRSLDKTWSMVVNETLPAKHEAQTKLYRSYAGSVLPALEAALATYADALLGIHRGLVVTAYDNLSRRRSGRHLTTWWIPVWALFEYPAVALIGRRTDSCPRRADAAVADLGAGTGRLRNWPRRTS
jgi:hypothetical protein